MVPAFNNNMIRALSCNFTFNLINIVLNHFFSSFLRSWIRLTHYDYI